MDRPEAGWYPDPEASGRVRYFDGTDWTDHVRDTAPSEPTDSGIPAADPPETAAEQLDATVPLEVVDASTPPDVTDAPTIEPAAAPNGQPAPRRRGLTLVVAIVLVLLFILVASVFIGTFVDGDGPLEETSDGEATDEGELDIDALEGEADDTGDAEVGDESDEGDEGDDPATADDDAEDPAEGDAEEEPETAPQEGPEQRDGSYDEPFDITIDPDATYLATIETSEGDIVLELDAAGATVTTNNLVNLARDGFYDGVIFHRVIEGFVVQGGDPTGTGAGGPGYRFEDELGPAEELVAAEGGYPRGTLAMANAGPDTNGSQFFIVHGDLVELPPAYTVFGEVTDGMDVVDTIAQLPTDAADRPTTDVTIATIEITES